MSLPGTVNAKDVGADFVRRRDGVYLPQATAAPGDAGSVGTVDLPASHGVTGEYDPNAPSAPASPKEGGRPPHGRPLRAVRSQALSRQGRHGRNLAGGRPRHRPLRRAQAILAPRPDRQRRFLVEAQVTGQLEHPGIVPVHELGVNEKGQPFYTMKFVRGQTLQKVVAQFHAAKHSAAFVDVEQFRLLEVFIALCQTVAYAHSRGVLHRDLKPENVILGPFGETLLLDWGMAKVIGQPDVPAEADAPASGGPAQRRHANRDPSRLDHGDARLHGARNRLGIERRSRSAQRRLSVRSNPLRDAHRQAAAPGAYAFRN